MKKAAYLVIILYASLTTLLADSPFGKLIFEDRFERNESQELKDELGNEWTTSSDKTAYGEKQVDLRDGHMYIYTHEKAWHAASIRHPFKFKDGTFSLKVKFDQKSDGITLNFTDLGEKSVHAGHLFNVSVSPTSVRMSDLKTGVHNLKIKKARKDKTLTQDQKDELKKKTTSFKHSLDLKSWHQVHVTVKGDQVSCTINGNLIGSFRSEGFAHPSKTLMRFLVDKGKTVHVDDVEVYRKS